MSRRQKQKARERVSCIASSGMKKNFAIALLIAIFVSLGSVVFANSPGPVGSVTINVENMPANVAYIDVLVKISENNDLYVKCNDWITTEVWLNSDSKMVLYENSGYRSYSAHVKGAEPLMNLLEGTPITHYEFTVWKHHYQQMKDLFPLIKIALVDASGSIFQVSPAINIPGIYKP